MVIMYSTSMNCPKTNRKYPSTRQLLLAIGTIKNLIFMLRKPKYSDRTTANAQPINTLVAELPGYQ